MPGFGGSHFREIGSGSRHRVLAAAVGSAHAVRWRWAQRDRQQCGRAGNQGGITGPQKMAARPGSDASGERAAAMYSLIGSAKRRSPVQVQHREAGLLNGFGPADAGGLARSL